VEMSDIEYILFDFEIKKFLPNIKFRIFDFDENFSSKSVFIFNQKNIPEKNDFAKFATSIFIGEKLPSSEIEADYFLKTPVSMNELKFIEKNIQEKFEVNSYLINLKDEVIVRNLSGNIHDAMSHLNNISARMQFLEMQVRGNEHIKKASRITVDQSEKISGIFKNIQIFSKASFKKEHESIGLNFLINDAFRMVKYRLIQSKFNLEIPEISELYYLFNTNPQAMQLFAILFIERLFEAFPHESAKLTVSEEDSFIILSITFENITDTSKFININQSKIMDQWKWFALLELLDIKIKISEHKVQAIFNKGEK
jgi:hypothetical protein